MGTILDPAPFPLETLPHCKGGHLKILFSPPSKENLSWRCHTEASCSLGSVEESPYFTKDHLGDYQRREAAYALKMSSSCPNLPSSRELDIEFRDPISLGRKQKNIIAFELSNCLGLLMKKEGICQELGWRKSLFSPARSV